jgi:hypothetical protein
MSPGPEIGSDLAENAPDDGPGDRRRSPVAESDRPMTRRPPIGDDLGGEPRTPAPDGPIRTVRRESAATRIGRATRVTPGGVPPDPVP